MFSDETGRYGIRQESALLFRDSRLSSERPAKRATRDRQSCPMRAIYVDTEIEIQEIYVRNLRFDQRESYAIVQSLFG